MASFHISSPVESTTTILESNNETLVKTLHDQLTEIDYHGKINTDSNEDNIYQNLDNLKNDLDTLLKPLDWPPEKKFLTLFDVFKHKDFPSTYQSNNDKEIWMINTVENFRTQYSYIYKDRKPLFLSPLNECDITKFVCTTLCPTKLPHREVYDWDGATKFVADYLNYSTLIPETELPRRLLSPSTVLKIQKGTCFDYANLLTSLLLGVGYDAYVVSGYAKREVCYLDEKLIQCPFIKVKEDKKDNEIKPAPKKYAVKQCKDYRSEFEIFLEARHIYDQRTQQKLQDERHAEAEKEAEKPPPDRLFGLRVHAWVLILPGKRGITEGFFIETSTGKAHPLRDYDGYNGIESVWNDKNYWVNMQTCKQGINDISYDLENETTWEHIIPFENEGSLMTTYEYTSNDEDQDELFRKQKLKQDHILYSKRPDLPPTWTSPIIVDRRQFESEFPNNCKVEYYKRVVLERYAGYFLNTGMIRRIKIYSDREYTDHLTTEEYFINRKDNLNKRRLDIKTEWVTEYFNDGRSHQLKEHTFNMSSPGPEEKRSMTFCHKVRVDGLIKRDETPTELTDNFIGRSDRLYFRHTVFEPRYQVLGVTSSHSVCDKLGEFCSIEAVDTKEESHDSQSFTAKIIDKRKSNEDESASQVNSNADIGHKLMLLQSADSKRTLTNGNSAHDDNRIIKYIIERFERNPAVEADDDVAERAFHIWEGKIKLTYHKAKGNISVSTREYQKSELPENEITKLTLTDETHACFMVDQFAKPLKRVQIYQLFLDLLKLEDVAKDAVRWAENETRNIVAIRSIESSDIELDVSHFDSLRNDAAKTRRIEMEKHILEEKLRYQKISLDYLAPFLAQLGFAERLSWSQACQLREDCLEDFKQRLIDKARLIQSRIAKETTELQDRQQWYMENRVNMSETDEEKYVEMCNQSTFLITTLRVMLTRHRQVAPHRYIELEYRIRQDPRLAILQHQPSGIEN